MSDADTSSADAGGHRLLLVAGEASGDLHAASLVEALRALDPQLTAIGIGGSRMRGAGVELLYDIRHLAVVGITEVIAHLHHIRRAMNEAQRAVRERQIDAIILVDYPDFNIALAKRLRRAHPSIPIIYYIGPQVWAWRPGRVRTLSRLVNLMLVILPFEAELYADAGVPVEFVGHPLLDVMPGEWDLDAFVERHDLDVDRDWVALAPGSRPAEVERLLPAMLEAAAILQRSKPRQYLVPVAAGVDIEIYDAIVAGAPAEIAASVHLIKDDSYGVLRHSRAACVCSGTATLETGLLGTPELVVYRTSWLTYNLARLLVRVSNIALVNVVAGRQGVPELLQNDVTGSAIARGLAPLLEDETARQQTHRFLLEVREKLGEPGASGRAAAGILRLLASR